VTCVDADYINNEYILEDVRDERCRQEALRAQGKFPATCATVGENEMSDDRCMTVLGEEVGEVAKELNERDIALGKLHPMRPINKLRAELIQVAAVTVAWVERIDYYHRDDPCVYVDAPHDVMHCETHPGGRISEDELCEYEREHDDGSTPPCTIRYEQETGPAVT